MSETYKIMKTQLVTELKRKATKIIVELGKDKNPVLITERGRPAAYLVNVDLFDALQRRVKILEGIARGEKALREGNTLTQAQAKRKLKKWLS